MRLRTCDQADVHQLTVHQSHSTGCTAVPAHISGYVRVDEVRIDPGVLGQPGSNVWLSDRQLVEQAELYPSEVCCVTFAWIPRQRLTEEV